MKTLFKRIYWYFYRRNHDIDHPDYMYHTLVRNTKRYSQIMTDKEHRIFQSYAFEKKSLEEIGLDNHCTRERIRQILSKIARKLRS